MPKDRFKRRVRREKVIRESKAYWRITEQARPKLRMGSMKEMLERRERRNAITSPDAHLGRMARAFPRFWRTYEDLRVSRGKGLPDWPSWCFCPLAAAYAIISGGGDNRVDLSRTALVGQLGCVAAWRPTKGIYRFDPDLAQALVDTPITGDLPREHLYRLPEWCVYVDPAGALPARGFFAYLEHDANDGRAELSIYVDADNDTLIPIVLHLVDGGLEASLQAFAREATAQRALAGGWATPVLGRQDIERLAQAAAPMVSLLLYLCADEPDYGDREPPQHPRRRRGRVTGAHAPTEWDVGARIGAALRTAQERDSEPGEGTHASPRPHVRRAHWHTYWVGKRGSQKPALRWLSPMLVGGSGVVTTTRPVKS